MSDDYFQASCHCGNVKIHVSHQPEFMQDCNCSLCRNSGAVWGYFDPADVQIEGLTSGYTRQDYTDPAVDIRSCRECGATTHWVLTDVYVAKIGSNSQIGVNMRLFEAEDLEGVELRFPDGKNWFGEGEFGFRRPSVILGESYAL